MFGVSPKCPECGRVFDIMNNKVDSVEWSYGHDCEE